VAAGSAELVGRLQRGLAVALLCVVGAAAASTLDPADLAHRARLLARALAGERVPLREEPGFWFDPDYAVFLEEVKKRVPEGASVAVLAPAWPDVYAYQAAYQLAPRRVVGRRYASEASFVAVYGALEGPARERIPYGALRRR
jgi:hypothetical protein